jgi:hypothetical protein
LPAALAENSTIDPNRAALLTERPSGQNLQTSEKQCKSITTHHAMK